MLGSCVSKLPQQGVPQHGPGSGQIGQGRIFPEMCCPTRDTSSTECVVQGTKMFKGKNIQDIMAYCKLFWRKPKTQKIFTSEFLTSLSLKQWGLIVPSYRLKGINSKNILWTLKLNCMLGNMINWLKGETNCTSRSPLIEVHLVFILGQTIFFANILLALQHQRIIPIELW